MAKIEHFEVPADDVARAKSFYGTVFGFEFEDWDESTTMIKAAEGGIGGDIHKRSEVPHPTFVVTVDDIEVTLEAIVANGGSQVGAIQQMGDSARYVYVTDSEGNMIGLYDSTATA